MTTISHTTTYPYSLAISAYGIIILTVYSVPHLINFISINDFTSAWFSVLFNLWLFITAAFVAIKYLIPALRGKIALELNDDGLISYPKNVTVRWADINKIERRNARYLSVLYIKFKHPNEHGTYIRVLLQWVKGDDGAIYDTVMEYYQKYR